MLSKESKMETLELNLVLEYIVAEAIIWQPYKKFGWTNNIILKGLKEKPSNLLLDKRNIWNYWSDNKDIYKKI